MAEYHRPVALSDALALLGRGPVTVAAGCTDLFPGIDGPALRGPVLDITAIDGLRGIEASAEGWRIGATTTWSDLLAADLPPAFDMLKAAAREVGSVQIQNTGTVAGNLCNASPAADGVPPLLALDASVELTSTQGTRALPLERFLTGVRQTGRAASEMVTAVTVPRRAGAGVSRFLKLGARRYLVISIAMIAARLVLRIQLEAPQLPAESVASSTPDAEWVRSCRDSQQMRRRVTNATLRDPSAGCACATSQSVLLPEHGF